MFGWRIVLLPDEFDLASGEAPVDVIVRPVDALRTDGHRPRRVPPDQRAQFDDVFPARITWANKPMEIWVRRELVE